MIPTPPISLVSPVQRTGIVRPMMIRQRTFRNLLDPPEDDETMLQYEADLLLADFAHMTTIIAFFIIVLAAGIIVPTLPGSRGVRLILAVIAVPVVIFGYQRIEVYASYIGATHMDMFIERSERLLKEGKTNVVLAAYQDYREQHGAVIPKSSAAAHRAWLLDRLMKQREMERDAKP